MMKKLTLFTTLLLSLQALGQTPGRGVSRSPAIPDNTCNLEIVSVYTVMVNGKEIKKATTEKEEKKILCKEVRQCMNSAEEELMPDLKRLEDLSCDQAVAVTPKTPQMDSNNKNFDGKRVGKETEPHDSRKPAESTPNTSR